MNISLPKIWRWCVHHLKCLGLALLYLVVSSIGLFIPIATFSILKRHNNKIDFTVIKYLFNDKNLLVFCLTLTFTTSLIYYASKCNSLFIKIMVGVSLFIAACYGIILLVATAEQPSNCITDIYMEDVSRFAYVALFYAFVIQYYLNKKFNVQRIIENA